MLIKKAAIVLFSLFFGIGASAQFDNQLRKQNEEIIFAFQLKDLKWVSLCKEKSGSYIVYRFGNKRKIELQYPELLDSTSWQQFTFQGYIRGGGKQNAAMRFGYLNFYNNNFDYEVYEFWSSEDDKENLFKKFKKLSARPTAGENSNGLGLAIVKTLVDRMKGNIELTSEKGKGSQFLIRFPQQKQYA